MTRTTELKSSTKAELLKLAKSLGAEASSSMLKDELVSIVLKAERANSRKKVKTKKAPARSSKSASGGTSKKPAAKTAKKTVKKKASKKIAAAAPKAKTRANPKGKSAAAKATPSASTTTKKTSVAALEKAKPRKPVAASNKKAGSKKTAKAPAPKSKTSPKTLKKIRELQLQRDADKDIGFRPTQVRPPGASEPIWANEPQQDRIALFVRDAYWMHAAWDVTRGAVDRAKAAMAEQWHAAKPVLRLIRLEETGNNASETVENDIEIRGGIRNWYLPINGDSTMYRVAIGYVAGERFHAIARSNIVTTPAAGTSDDVEEHWSDPSLDTERIFALSGGYNDTAETEELQAVIEERANRNMGAPPLAKLGAGADGPFRRRGEFHFDMEIEMVVYGSSTPDAYLTLNGEPVTLRSDGTFAMRLPFPDRRQVLPAVACSRDGSQQRTIVVAVERNTKIMEPLEQERDTGE